MRAIFEMRYLESFWRTRWFRWPIIAEWYYHFLRVHHGRPFWAITLATIIFVFGECRGNSRQHLAPARPYLERSAYLCVFLGQNMPLLLGEIPHVDNLRLWLDSIAISLILVLALYNERKLRSTLTQFSITHQSEFPPPRAAELLLSILLPRREREPLLGDLREGYVAKALPELGPMAARRWYWLKALQYLAIYAHEAIIDPIVTYLIEPFWRRVLFPLLKWIGASLVALLRTELIDALRSIIDRHLHKF